jgi:VanZ family protein
MKAALFVLYTGLIGWLSLSPVGPPGMEWLQLWDKAMHCSLYAIYLLLGCTLISRRQPLAWLAIGIFAYGALLELGQSLVPGRDMSVLDMLANGLGIGIGAWAALQLTDTFEETANT